MQNTIVLAFETVSSLRARVELLLAFQVCVNPTPGAC
jgi:hypothetical protein